MRLLALAALVFAGCARKVAGPTSAVEGALHTQTCGDVTAAFIGKRDEGPGPDWFFTERLEFHFASGLTLPFHESGEVYPHNRTFELFSPDCEWLALPQDNYGPYHLVKTAQLEGYLRGTVKPASIQKTGSVHTDLSWRSATELEFFASCCGGVEVFRVNVAAPEKLERVFFAAEAPRGVTRAAEGGFTVN